MRSPSGRLWATLAAALLAAGLRTGVAQSARCSPAFVANVALRSPANAQSASAGVEVRFGIPPDIPLAPAKVESSTGGPVPHYDYSLRNTGTRSIVALAIKWTMYVGDQAVGITKTDRADSWIGGPTAWLGPGQEMKFALSGVLTRDGKASSRYEGAVVYVEFDDGTRLGPEADSIFSALTGIRQAILDEYRRALAAYDASGKDGLVAELAQAKTAVGTKRGRVTGATMLLSEMQRLGLDATVAELRRASTLRVPE